MFLTDQDYLVVVGESALRTITQASPELRQRAEQAAIEEISSYLRPAYDVKAIFAEGQTGRNPIIVTYTADIALHHLISSLPQKMGSEVRRERYERAIKWLEGVQAGRIIPDLPTPQPQQSSSAAPHRIAYSSEPPLRHAW